MANNELELLSLKKAKEDYGVPIHSLREAIVHSELPFVRTTERARKFYIPRGKLEEWIRKRIQYVR